MPKPHPGTYHTNPILLPGPLVIHLPSPRSRLRSELFTSISLCLPMSTTSGSRSVIGPLCEKSCFTQIGTLICSGESTRREMSMDDCHIIGLQRKLRHTHIFLPMWACSRFAAIVRPSPHETIKAKLPSTLPVGVEPVLRSSACSPSLPRQLVRWLVMRWPACTHQWLIGGLRWMGGSHHDRGQTATSSSTSTMTSWCVKCSNTTILIFFEPLLAIALYTATPSCFLLFE